MLHATLAMAVIRPKINIFSASLRFIAKYCAWCKPAILDMCVRKKRNHILAMYRMSVHHR